MSTSAQAIQEEMRSVADQMVNGVPATLRKLKSYHQTTNADIAEAMGQKPNWVQERMKGTIALSLPDIIGFARAFGVTTEVLFMDPAEAVQWSITHQAEPAPRSRCFTDGPPLVGASAPGL